MGVLNGFDVNTRERVWIPGDKTAETAFWAEVHDTSVWRRFLSEFGNTPANNQRVVEVLDQLHEDAEYITTSLYLDALGTAMNAGELDRKPITPETIVAQPTEVPRDRNGRPLSPAQVAWGEMARFANFKSMREINERKRVDPAFANFIQTNLRREMAVEIDGAVVPEGEHTGNVPRVSPSERERLVRFAQEFNALPASEARKKMLAGFNPQHEEFQADFEKCRALRLL